MKRFIVGFLAIFGFVALLLTVAIGTGTYFVIDRLAELDGAEPEDIEDAVLLVDLRAPLPDGPEPDPLASAFDQGPSLGLQQALQAIEWAGADDAIKGMVVRLSGDNMGLSSAQALHRAIIGFRETGKPVIAQSSSFGEFGPGTISYMIASAASTIAVLDGGAVGLTGLHASVPFAANTLALVGLEADVSKRGQYKTAPETATESQMSPAHRRMLESLTGDLYRQITTDISINRNIAQDTLDALVDRAPLSADEALEAGLIDTLVSWQDIDQLLAPLDATSDDLLEIRHYYSVAEQDRPEPDHLFAVIYGLGTIVEGDSPDEIFGSGGQMGADTIARAITNAVDDDRYAGIVLRVNSGGGSAIASEIIAQAVDYAAEQGKPLVISMGTAAASGAYWISTHATAIVAEGATLTGSIGVFAGKMVTGGLWDKLGINWGSVSQGAHSGMFSTEQRFSPSERVRLNRFLDKVYGRFIDRVAEGRGLPREAVEDLAQGRVWTGAQAIERGLVDRIGGMKAAIDEVRLALHIPADAIVSAEPFPKPRNLIDRVMSLARTETNAAMLPPALRKLSTAIETIAPRGITQMAPLTINGQLY